MRAEPCCLIHFHVEDVCDEIQSILVVVNFGVESREVESICEVILVDLAEVLIATSCYELGNRLANELHERSYPAMNMAAAPNKGPSALFSYAS